MMGDRRLRLAAPLALVLTAAFAVGACGSSDDDSSSTSGAATTAATTGGSSDAAGVTAAKELVTKATTGEGLDYGLPTEPVDPMADGKKRVAVISIGQNTATGPVNTKAKVEAIKAIGWTPGPVWDAQYVPAKVANFIQQAIQQKYDAIFLDGVQPGGLSASFKAAEEAGIPLICMQCTSGVYENKPVIDVRSDYNESGKLLAAYTLARMNGKGTILEFPDHAYPAVEMMFDGYDAYLSQNCPDCQTKSTDFNALDAGKPGPPVWTAALANNRQGSFDAAQAPYDFAAISMLKTSQQAGRDEFISGFNATPPFVDLMKSGQYDDLIGATTTDSPGLLAYAGVDLLARHFAKQELWDATKFPVGLVTLENVDKFDDLLDPLGFDYRAAFKKLWTGGGS